MFNFSTERWIWNGNFTILQLQIARALGLLTPIPVINRCRTVRYTRRRAQVPFDANGANSYAVPRDRLDCLFVTGSR
jgi:hypothetical protein